MGIEKIAEVARILGLGQSFNIEMSAVTSGLVPDKIWKQKTRSREWVVGDTVNSSIGQGYVLSSPLQLAVMTARLANGGFAVTPRLVRASGKEGEEDRPKFKSVGISRRSLNIVCAGMNKVTNETGGTAYRARIVDEGLEMAGKTGTVQVRRISKAERETRVLKNHELAWQERDHALFVGYAPSKNPRYAVTVVVEHGGDASKIAAPIARDLLLATQKQVHSSIKNPPDNLSRHKDKQV